MSEETRQMSQNRFLDRVLNRGPLNAGVFFTGTACGTSRYETGDKGFLHLIRRGPVRIEMDAGQDVDVAGPALVLISQSLPHRVVCDETEGAALVCAHLSFENLIAHPRLVGLPELLVLPFNEDRSIEDVAQRLFSEAFENEFGRDHVVDLLVELLLVYVLRNCIAAGHTDRGILGGLSDAKLTRVLIALQDDMAADWNVESMAVVAGMSRANFAAHFKTRIGTSPASFLTSLRLTLARQMLLDGKPLKNVSEKVGYKSPTALSRSFQRHFGLGPREILRLPEQS